MSDLYKFWKEEACGITFDYPHEGGEFAWNHQQKKIDAALKFIGGYNSVDIENDVVLKDCINEIKELLK